MTKVHQKNYSHTMIHSVHSMVKLREFITILKESLPGSMEVVYWYNVTAKDNISLVAAPANMIHHYQVGERN